MQSVSIFTFPQTNLKKKEEEKRGVKKMPI